MREAAEDLLSADPVLSEIDLRWPGASLADAYAVLQRMRARVVVAR
jgi:hypothetical protein